MPPVRQRPKPKPQEKKEKTQGNNQTRTIAIVITLLVICVVGGYFLYPVIKNSLSKKPVQVIREPEPVDTLQQEPPVIEPVPEPHKVESSASVPKGFYIIVGSYRNKYNADNLQKNLKKDIEPEILFFEELGLYRVSTGKYETIHKAYNDLFSIRDIDGCENAWVLENI